MSDVTLNAAATVPEAAPRSAPLTQVGFVGWVRTNLFSGWLSTAVTLVLAYFIIRWAIGYPDLVSIANTTMNQTGQAIEGIAIIMAVYLTISLSISVLMNWYNARVLR